MKKLVLLMSLFFIPIIFSANNTFNNESNMSNSINQSLNNSNNNFLNFVDNSSLLILLIGLVIFYIIGKIAFKFVKWGILIVAIVLLLKIILNL